MKFLYLITLFIISFNFTLAQKDSIVFEDEADAKDFENFSKQQIVDLVDSLNNIRKLQEEFYRVNAEGVIELDSLKFISFPKFQSELDKKYYFWLKKKLYKAYPYYLKAVRNYENLSDSLQRFEKNKKLKRYIKKRQRDLADEYEDQLKGLTRTEGQILSKLLHRRTGITTYEIIQELRGNLNAYIWEAKAGLFDISLKKEFNPAEVRDDYYLDNIIRKGISSGELELE